jgi:hypothetical protein
VPALIAVIGRFGCEGTGLDRNRGGIALLPRVIVDPLAYAPIF